MTELLLQSSTRRDSIGHCVGVHCGACLFLKETGINWYMLEATHVRYILEQLRALRWTDNTEVGGNRDRSIGTLMMI